MATKMTAHGVSTTTTPGTEQYEVFYRLKPKTRCIDFEGSVKFVT